MRVLFAAALFAVALTNASNAQSTRIARIEIVEPGIYQVQVTGTKASPGTAAQSHNTVTNERLVQATTRIPASLGTRFGFRYRVVGDPAGATVALKIIAYVPHPGMRNPGTGNTMLRQEVSVTNTLGNLTYFEMSFEDTWEMVPGKWTFEIWDGTRKFASQSFEVVKQ